MSNKKWIYCLIILIAIFCNSLLSQVRLPRIISDGMVIQRDSKVKIWGWASPEEKIVIIFNNKSYNTKADKNGQWKVFLDKMKAGGPYEMVIKSKNEITIKDILIGDVWLCSGQSNMELPIKRVRPIYENEIKESTNNFIRQFIVPQKYDFNEQKADIEKGNWKSSNPENVLDFSAVGYFFANELFKKNGVPIGLINASLGGSPIESWISEDALKKFPSAYEELQKFKDNNLINEIESKDKKRIDEWYGKLWQNDEGYKDTQNPWYSPSLNDSDWLSIQIPGYWNKTELNGFNGCVWFRKEISIPKNMENKPAKLILGRIVDADSTFINGKFIGYTSYQYPPRWYSIPPNVLKEGKNIITVRLISNIGNGGFVPDKQYILFSDNDTIDLKGEWKYKIGSKMEPLAGPTFIRWKPAGLFNAMISPLLNYNIKGVIWYQGESNAGKYEEYLDLFKTMVIDWRKKWNIGNFPFLYVQLPNFGDKQSEPKDEYWAFFRETQLKSLSIPNTGMAITIDLGEWNDIHPLNKKDVGKRLALIAQKVAYNSKNIVHTGPIYKSMTIKNNKVIITFNNIGSGLVVKGDELKGFVIKGENSKFVWAKAKIENNKVVVWSDEIKKPVAVRYAWANNPEGANLYNKEGLPASPFRTDNYPFEK